DTTTRLGFARKFCETVGQFITCKSLTRKFVKNPQKFYEAMALFFFVSYKLNNSNNIFVDRKNTKNTQFK
ncbi:MAG: hypothetical protein MJK14_13195, partial [Rivularia sp. ALOHA_DT_140]|nr:hypothetical protein [Rivularia sp. ALOHA_DT_140]